MERRGQVEGRIYLGRVPGGWRLARPEEAVMVLGPPRSGKTSSLVVPNVVLAGGPVVSTSTKLDVLEATAAPRRAVGTCWLFDPTGSAPAPAGVRPLRWSPVAAAGDWEDAVRVAVEMVAAARPDPREVHWNERAESLLAPLFHAAARAGGSMTDVVSWFDGRDHRPAAAQLAVDGSPLARTRLEGLLKSEDRELSGIWSTASGVLSCYRSSAALASADQPNFDPARFATSTDTVYVCAPGADQGAVAPVISGLLALVHRARYVAHASGWRGPALLLALDEVANIAPLRELPRIVAEGGGQGVLTLACLQDLSQARHRWGPQADGFMTLFGTKVLLGGVSDPATLRAVSEMCGEVEVRSPSRGWSGGRMSMGWNARPRRRLPPDAVREGRRGEALVIEGASPPGWVRLTPAHSDPGWRRQMAVLAGGRSSPSQAPLERDGPGL